MTSGYTSRQPISWHDYYLQSYLTGVTEIFVGYHSDGMLNRIESITLDSITQDKLGGNTRANLQKSYNTAFRLLDALRTHCQAESASASSKGIVWRVQARPASGDTLIRQLSHEEMEILNPGERREGILPLWFVDGLETEQAQ